MKVIICTYYEWYPFEEACNCSEEFEEMYRHYESMFGHEACDKIRTDQKVIEFVLANKDFSKTASLRVVDIPDEATDWDIFTDTYSGEDIVYVENGKLRRIRGIE